MLNQEQSLQLLELLRKNFDEVLNILPVAPFLIIECDKAIPDPSTTPFMIAGLIAVFMLQGEDYPFGIEFIGADGGAMGLTEQEMPHAVWNDLKPFHIPKLSTFEWIHQYFSPYVAHVSTFPQQIVVEFHPMTDEEFDNALIKLPDTLGVLNVGYVNGTILTKRLARALQPQPRELDGQYDDTDYLHTDNGGVLRPGMLLECAGYVDEKGVRKGIFMSNSGVKVQKNGVNRITVAAHGWDEVEEKIVYHPTRNGHKVGTVVEQIGEDIGLMSFCCNYSNELPDAGITAKSLFPSTQLQYNQYVMIDSCFTGIQTLKVLGVRTGADRRIPTGEGAGIAAGPLNDHHYIKIAQGIYGVNAAVIPREPQIREGMCGTPLIVAGKNKREMAEVIKDGKVAGFMLWNDIQGRYGLDRQIYSFCQPVDPLISEGWSVNNA